MMSISVKKKLTQLIPSPLKKAFIKLLAQPKINAYRYQWLQKKLLTDSNKQKILLVSHELSNTGAPKALFLLALALKKAQYHVILAAPKSGPLKQTLTAAKIPVLIDSTLFLTDDKSKVFDQLAHQFDLMIANTIGALPTVKRLQKQIPTLWWIHEGADLKDYLPQNNAELFKETLAQCQHIYTVSTYAKEFIKAYTQNPIHILTPGIIDQAASFPAPPTHRPITFTTIGAFEYRKAPDILIKAIEKLPKSYQQKAQFNLVGKKGYRPLFNELKTKISQYPCIKYCGAPSKEKEVLNIINHSDVIVCVSRYESLSIAVLEGWMLAKPCLISDTVGVKTFVKPGSNGFIIKSENIDELAHYLKHIIDHPQALADMASAARATFTEHFSFEKFSSNAVNCINALLDAKE